MNKKKKSKVVKMLSPENYIRQKARTLPVRQCHINSDWKESGLASVIVARQHTTGNFTVGSYLVDLNCLGVKDAMYSFNVYAHEYHKLYRKGEPMELEPVSYGLVHNIIYAGLEFAEEYGFRPRGDFAVARYILEEDTDEIELIDIDCGHNGKPFYIQGPLDSDVFASEILAQLEKTAGSGNYDFLLSQDEDEPEDDWEDDSENDSDAGDDDLDNELYDEKLNKMLLDQDFSLKDELSSYLEDENFQNSKTFQFKIQLKDINKPPVWRRVLVPSYYSFLHFHSVIQIAFGWADYHLFRFSENGNNSGRVISKLYDDADAGFEDQEDAGEVLLSDVFEKEKQTYLYLYDFGDSWEHLITLEKIIPEVSASAELTDGKGACPPEDCGGPWGYKDLKIILADKTHPDHHELNEWLGLEEDQQWDPNEFNKEEIQQEFDDIFGI